MPAGCVSTGAAEDESAFSCMQNHAPYSCTRNLSLASQEKAVLGEVGRAMPLDSIESGGAEEGA